MNEHVNTFQSRWYTDDGEKPNTNPRCAFFMQEKIPGKRTFNLSLTQPKDKDKGREWALNREITVVADDIHRANTIHFFQ